MAHDLDPLDALEQRLSDLLIHIRETGSEQSWQEAESVAKALANALRVRDGPGKMILQYLDPVFLNEQLSRQPHHHWKNGTPSVAELFLSSLTTGIYHSRGNAFSGGF